LFKLSKLIVPSEPLHVVGETNVEVNVGFGFTVTTKLTGDPTQDVVAGPVGVITYVTVPAILAELFNISEIFPAPLALKPVTVPDVKEAVQAKVVLVTPDVGENEALDPEQIACVKVAFVTVGVGFTVTTKLTGDPTHDEVTGPVGVITYVTVPIEFVEFVKTSEIFPAPLVLKPVTVPDVKEAVQAKVVLTTPDVGENVALDPEQIACVKVAFVTVGIGFTVTTKLTGVPTHNVDAGPVGVIT
jgi:hypothetical protein